MNKQTMRFVISVEVEITDEIAVRAGGVSNLVDTEGQLLGPYVPSGDDFGLITEIGNTFVAGGLPALHARDGVSVIVAQTLTGQAAEDGKYPAFTVPAAPASGD